LNLLYRRRADTVAGENEREQLMKIADDLLDRLKDIKQKRSETSSQPESKVAKEFKQAPSYVPRWQGGRGEAG
jgi:hypothetical protein